MVVTGSFETGKVAGKVIKAGSIATASGGAAGSVIASSVGPIQLVLAATVFTAQTGIEFRKFKQGKISKKEFKRRTKKNGVKTTGGVMGASTGSVAGFFIGQILIPFPVVGGLIGTIVFGTVGGILG